MTLNVNLQQFDGPLDVLLHLIEKAELDIKDIFISEITAQYIEYIQGMQTMDMDLASEFLSMASRLLYIKSRYLLPKPPKECDNFESIDDPELELIRQLQEYKAFKQASSKLNELSEIASHSRSKLPEEFLLPEQCVIFKGGTANDIFESFKNILNRCDSQEKNNKELQTLVVEKYTVRGCMQNIREALLLKEDLLFEELFEGRLIKMKVIVTFMALLEMVMRSEIIIKQQAPYNPIHIVKYNISAADDIIDYTDIELY